MVAVFFSLIWGLTINGCKKIEIKNIQENNKINVVQTEIINDAVFKYPIIKYNDLKSFLNDIDNEDIKTESNFYSLLDYFHDAKFIFDSLGIDGLKENNFDLLYFKYDTSGIFELNILDEQLAHKLSPEGYILFGDTIMKINPENIIYIDNADFSLVESINDKDFSNKNIHVNDSKSFPIVQKEMYYDNGWDEGCHRIYLQRWYRNYEFYVRAGVTISYYTRIYKRNILLKKKLVWIKKDKADLYVHASCDKMMTVVYYQDDGLDTAYYYTKNLFEKYSNSNHFALSKNPTNLSFSLWALTSILNFYIYNYKMSYLTPIKNGLL